jgi:hypothetical protein
MSSARNKIKMTCLRLSLPPLSSGAGEDENMRPLNSDTPSASAMSADGIMTGVRSGGFARFVTHAFDGWVTADVRARGTVHEAHGQFRCL